MKPLEEYMLFTKSGADNITVINPQGVRSAQCNAKFDVSEQPTQEPMVNVSMVSRHWEKYYENVIISEGSKQTTAASPNLWDFFY